MIMSFEKPRTQFESTAVAPLPVAEALALQALAMGPVRETHELRRAYRQPLLAEKALREWLFYNNEGSRRVPPKGRHRFSVFDNGDRQPASREGCDTYLGVSVAKDIERRDSWGMLITVRSIPVYDEASPPTPDEPGITTWEQYKFEWKRGQSDCTQAWLRTHQYSHVVRDGRHEITGPTTAVRPIEPKDCHELGTKMTGVVQAIGYSYEDELELLFENDVVSGW